MDKEMNILFVSDEDSYKTMWINGERVFDGSDGVRIEDVLWTISNKFNENPAERVEVRTFSMYDASTSDIPDSVNDCENLESWYLDQTGEEIEVGW